MYVLPTKHGSLPLPFWGLITDVGLLMPLKNDHYMLGALRTKSNRIRESDPVQQKADGIEQADLQGISAGNSAIIVTDHTKPDEPVAYVNHAFEDLTGYKLAEVIGFHPHFLRTSDRDQVGVKALESAIRSGRACSAVLRDYRKNNTPIWYQVSISPVFSKDGQLTHFFGALKDVTTQIEAQQKEEDRETFIATLAHDLKTPLLGAERMFALITAGAFGNVDPELHKTLVLMSNGNRKALELVRNLLESYRLGQGSELMHFETLDLPALIERTVEEVEATVDSNRLKIQTSISENLPPCVFDRLAISRLLSNLLDNAVKFTPEEGKVWISAESSDGKVVLKVGDTGIGIPDRDKDLIFRKCKRSKKNSRYVPGCGLGLYICKAIVKAHGGQISFESQEQIGTIFTVLLPFKCQQLKQLTRKTLSPCSLSESATSTKDSPDEVSGVSITRSGL